MRVIAGRYRRRHLQSLPGLATRPMLDRQRETLFNVLQNDLEGAVFVDLYAGTGAVGIEALSRGASQVFWVESNPQAVAIIRANLSTLGITENAVVLSELVARVVSGLTADIFFLGPPYEAHKEYEQTLSTLGEHPPKLVIAQHARAHHLAAQYGELHRYRVIRQGNNTLTFYKPAQVLPPTPQPAVDREPAAPVGEQE
ncbi:MAG: 16S rRNA (guanine(966)-N(2))-methyltransferase RsmD [Acidobacteria bacterium]|nr:16S rRNA (guanine(966)-N(2))-methyltransferase RsmD [Acidobacteriota bacterium]